MKLRDIIFGLPLLLATFPAARAQPQMYKFVTIAGNPSAGSSDGINSEILFFSPFGVACDPSGNVFVADSQNSTIRKLTRVGANWLSSTIAGVAGRAGFADGTNSDARFNVPAGIVIDSSGSLFVADVYNFAIRKLTPSGTNWVVKTIAGSLSSSYLSPDGTNNTIEFSFPTSVAVNPAGEVFVADHLKLRKLKQFGTNWVSTTLVMTNQWFYEFNAVACDNVGNLFVTGDYEVIDQGFFGVIARVTVSGTNCVGENLPRPPDGNRGSFFGCAPIQGGVVVTRENDTVWQCLQDDVGWFWTKIAGKTWNPGSSDGFDYDAQFDSPWGIAADADGSLYVADAGNNTIRKIDPIGSDWLTTTVAGVPPNTSSADGTNKAGLFSGPAAVTVDIEGKIYMADYGAHAIRQIERIGRDWVTTTIAGTLGLSGYADGTNSDSQFYFPSSVVAASPGILFVADYGNNTIRKLERTGTNWIATTIAGTPGCTSRQDGTNGDILFDGPNAIALDSAGNLYVAESGHNAVRKLTHHGADWISATIADEAGPVSVYAPGGLAVGLDGTIYVASPDLSAVGALTHAETIWEFGIISFGWPGTNWATPMAVTLDNSSGHLFFTDQRSSTIQKLVKVATNWVSYIIGGLPYNAGSADGTNSDARFSQLFGITVDSAGNLYVSDGNTIRMGIPIPVSASPPSVSITRSNADIKLTWNAVPGLTYQPQYSPDLKPAHWINLDQVIQASSNSACITIPVGTDSPQFYRVALLP